MEGCKKFPLFKVCVGGGGGREQFYPALGGKGGGAKSFILAIFPFCSPPPLPVINDQSLTMCLWADVGGGVGELGGGGGGGGGD